jgi:hypothetical protein
MPSLVAIAVIFLGARELPALHPRRKSRSQNQFTKPPSQVPIQMLSHDMSLAWHLKPPFLHVLSQMVIFQCVRRQAQQQIKMHPWRLHVTMPCSVYAMWSAVGKRFLMRGRCGWGSWVPPPFSSGPILLAVHVVCLQLTGTEKSECEASIAEKQVSRIYNPYL